MKDAEWWEKAELDLSGVAEPYSTNVDVSEILPVAKPLASQCDSDVSS